MSLSHSATGIHESCEMELTERIEWSEAANVSQHLPNLLIGQSIGPAVHRTKKDPLFDCKIQFHVSLSARFRCLKIRGRNDQLLDIRTQTITRRSMAADTVLLENSLSILMIS